MEKPKQGGNSDISKQEELLDDDENPPLWTVLVKVNIADRAERAKMLFEMYFSLTA